MSLRRRREEGWGAAVAFPSSFPYADSRAQNGQEWILSPSANNVKDCFQFPRLTICPGFMRTVSFFQRSLMIDNNGGVVWPCACVLLWRSPFQFPPPTGTHHYSPHTPDPDSAFPSRNPRIPSQRPQSGPRLNGQDRQQPTKGNITMLPWHFFFFATYIPGNPSWLLTLQVVSHSYSHWCT